MTINSNKYTYKKVRDTHIRSELGKIACQNILNLITLIIRDMEYTSIRKQANDKNITKRHKHGLYKVLNRSGCIQVVKKVDMTSHRYAINN